MHLFRTVLFTCSVLILIGFFVYGVLQAMSSSETTSVSKIQSDVDIAIRFTGHSLAYQILKIRYANDTPRVRHTAAHFFGERLYKDSGLSGFSVCDTDFNYGCYHGFLARAVAENGLTVISELDDACFSADPDRPSTCQHGIGHGILEYVGHDNLLQALTVCKTTRPVEIYAGCVAGVFMDYNIFARITETGEYVIDSRELTSDVNLYSPCTEVPEEFRPSCYHELPQWWNTHYRKDFTRLGQYCSGILVEDGRTACYFGLGGVIAAFLEYNQVTTIEACKEMPTENGVRTCIARVARAIDLNTPHHDVAVELCNTYAPDEPRCPHE
ncbi:hypothetical protein K2P56_05000 [Patescibacteria group bacterium]|nr:hypothetical protein [Patescibacteria group bacterium]